MKVDHERVAQLLEQTGSVRHVAETLGIHENTVRGIDRIKRGACVRCHARTAPQRTMCMACLKEDRARIKQRRNARTREAQCVQCGAPRSPHSRLYCDAHRKTAVDRNRKHDAKKRATEDRFGAMKGAPWGSARNIIAKERRLVERHGEGALRRWKHDGGNCQICAAQYGDVAIHIHHIDEEPSNNTFENFACLCYACHRAVHLLLASKDRPALIRWFRATYPDHPLD